MFAAEQRQLNGDAFYQSTMPGDLERPTSHETLFVKKVWV